MHLGDKAPYEGELLTPDLALGLGQAAADCDERVKAAAEQEQGIAAANLAQEKKLHAIDSNDLTAQLGDLQRQLANAQKIVQQDAPPFYTQPWFVAPVVAVGTAVAVIWAMQH